MMMTYPTTARDRRNHTPVSTIATFSFGPCWCRSVPGSDGSFDVFRQRSVKAPLGRDVLVVSNRVPPSGVAMVRRQFESLDDPIVIAARACPSADWYWDRSPSEWVDVTELLDVDHAVDACITGQPELIFAVLLSVRDTAVDVSRLTALTEAI